MSIEEYHINDSQEYTDSIQSSKCRRKRKTRKRTKKLIGTDHKAVKVIES